MFSGKNLAASYLPLEATPSVQTWTWTTNATVVDKAPN